MRRNVLLGASLLLIAVTAALFLWVRSVFTEDTVRRALASQLSSALGQPVTVGGISAGLYPRVTVNLRQVEIGAPARIRVETLHVGANLRALFSRRIEHARLELSGARVALPLPPFAINSDSESPGGSGHPPVELVSIDAIVLRNVEVVSGGRAVKGDIELVPEGRGVALRKMRLRSDDATIDVTGRITDLSGPAGDIAITAGTLRIDRLLEFATDFASGSGMTTAASARSGPSRRRTGAAPMDLAVSLAAGRAAIGALVLDRLAGKARITSDVMRLEPIAFGVFGGRYEGSLSFRLSDTPTFALNAALRGVDVARAAAFAGSPNTISGTLSGRLALTGRGLAAASVLQAARGTARVDIVNGVVHNLGLVRTIVVAASGRAESGGAAGGGSRDEPFTKIGTTLTIGGGSASTEDLRFESPNLLMNAAGTLRLDGSSVDLKGRAQLSDELSQRAGRDLVRYTQENGRVTLPVTITGPAASPHVRVDVVDAAKRALFNRAAEEAQKALKKGLGGLFKR
jgi:uncharacterized protein involved in outer membrane biogenesis